MTTNEDVEKTVRMILGPIAALLRSRKFVASFGAVIVSLLIVRVPDLAPYADTLILGIVLVAAALTGSIAYEDAETRKAAAIEAAARTNQENTQAAIEAVVEELFRRHEAEGVILEAVEGPPVSAEPVTVLPPVDPTAVG